MNHNSFLFLLFIFGICSSTIGQTTLTGVVLDVENQAVLPFVNIGIKHKNIGTTSSLEGKFSIQIPQQNENDTLTFSMVGYDELNLPIQTIIGNNLKTFQLKGKVTELNTVTVVGKKLVEKKNGISNNTGIIHFTDASTNQDDIFEIAQLIKLDTLLSKITSVNLHINEARIDSGTFRINFYGFDGIRPTERISEKIIIQTHPINEGWLKFDLTQHNVYFKGNVIVAIEFIPTEKKSNPIYYELKLGGSSKSFVRTSSQGEWAIPPHHYQLFITALVSEKKKQMDDEEKETVPTKILFSERVKDSFSIFISLPKDYGKKQQTLPVIYLLDANVYFDIVANTMAENKTNAILVGIGYSDFIKMDSLRERDYTFPKASSQDSLPISGGADKFLAFIKEELIPYVDGNYTTDTNKRTIMGHSLGGYFVLYALKEELIKNQTDITHFVAASPSLDYCDNYLMKEFKHTAIDSSPILKIVSVSFGGKEDSEDGGTATIGIDNFNSFCKLLSEKNTSNIKLKKEIYPTFRHMETAIPTFSSALKGKEYR